MLRNILKCPLRGVEASVGAAGAARTRAKQTEFCKVLDIQGISVKFSHVFSGWVIFGSLYNVN